MPPAERPSTASPPAPCRRPRAAGACRAPLAHRDPLAGAVVAEADLEPCRCMPVTTSPTPRQVSKQRCRNCGSGARDLLASVGLAGPDRRPGETSEPAPELGRQEGERSQERLPRGAPRERLDQRACDAAVTRAGDHWATLHGSARRPSCDSRGVMRPCLLSCSRVLVAHKDLDELGVRHGLEPFATNSAAGAATPAHAKRKARRASLRAWTPRSRKGHVPRPRQAKLPRQRLAVPAQSHGQALGGADAVACSEPSLEDDRAWVLDACGPARKPTTADCRGVFPGQV